MQLEIEEVDNGYLTKDIRNRDNGKQGCLPHGSGIDANWNVIDKDGFYVCSNSYHCMNENGMYDGWVDFSLSISKAKPEDFKLKFHTSSSGWYRVYKYNLRQYLEDLFAETFSELN